MKAPFVLCLSLLLAAMLGVPTAARAAVPQDARGFVSSIGVNTHLYYDDTAYANFAMVKQRLRELGVRHVRDGFDPSRRQWFYDRINSLGAVGIKSTLIGCQLTSTGWRNLDAYVSDAKNKIRSSLEALEGPNEPDLSGYSDWVEKTRGCQYWLNRLAKTDTYGAPLAQPIFGPSATGSTARHLGDLSDRADGGNFHPYPGARKPSGPDYWPFDQQMAFVRNQNFGGRSVPMLATETGYHDAVHKPSGGHHPASQRADAIYMPRLYLEYARAGVTRTFDYELVDQWPDPQRDDQEKNFGLFESDWSYKPVAHALKNMIGLLDSPSASSRSPLGYSVTGAEDPDGSGPGGAVKHRLLQKADGSWWLALWQDSTVWDVDTRRDVSNPANAVSVSLDRRMDFTGYLPTRGTGTYGSGRGASFRAGVPDDVLLVKLEDTTAGS